MEEETKKQIESLKNLSGKVRGQVFLTDIKYLTEQFGEEAVVKLKKKLEEWAIPIDYEKIKSTSWFPLGFRAISLLAIKEALGWGEKEIFRLGNEAPKYSFIVKMIMKYFLSAERTFQESPSYWKKHYTVGNLEAYEYSQENHYYIIRLKDFKIHPVLCPYLAGYFKRIGQYVEKGEIEIEETKCPFKGDPCHEFVLRWK